MIFLNQKIVGLLVVIGLLGVVFPVQKHKDTYVKLMLITNKKDKPLGEYLEFIRLCAQSGITSVQLREKDLSYDELREFGKQLLVLLKPFGIPLIVNDNANLAYELDADGVHLGQSDGNILEARALLGPNKIIGLSVYSSEQMLIANTLPIDYVGLGNVFSSKTKSEISVLGCDGFKKIALLSNHPVIAIGGIKVSNAGEVMRSGAHGIAAIGLFHDAQDPVVTIKYLLT